MALTFINPISNPKAYLELVKRLLLKFVENLTPSITISELVRGKLPGVASDLWLTAIIILLGWTFVWTAVVQTIFLRADDDELGADDDELGADDDELGAEDDELGAEDDPTIFQEMSSVLGSLLGGKSKGGKQAAADTNKAVAKAVTSGVSKVYKKPFVQRFVWNLLQWTVVAFFIYHVASLQKTSSDWLTLSAVTTPSAYYSHRMRRQYVPYTKYQPSF